MANESTRRVVIHADDLGMSHGANAAFAELTKLGVCSSGSVMVPCPWFQEIAVLAQADPSLDIGVHLTLTSEMRSYKWRPLTAPPASAGLTDALGYFHADVATLRATANPQAVEAELRAQIDVALASGIGVTHLDDHCGAVLAPEFCEIYTRLGLDYGIPILMTPSLTTYGGIHNLKGVADEAYRRHVTFALSKGMVMFDRIVETPWHPEEPPETTYRKLIAGIAPGLTFFAMHFTMPGEIEAIDRQAAHIRIGEYRLFRSPGFGSWLRQQGLTLIGMKDVRGA